MFGMPCMSNECDCGSNKQRWPEYDGYKIFLCYVCEDCVEQKLSMYGADIKERYQSDEPIEEDY